MLHDRVTWHVMLLSTAAGITPESFKILENTALGAAALLAVRWLASRLDKSQTDSQTAQKAVLEVMIEHVKQSTAHTHALEQVIAQQREVLDKLNRLWDARD